MNTSEGYTITGLVLSGGQGSRMGGVDKGLQTFGGQPLARRALERLRPQVGPVFINANRHLETYAAWGASVCPDAQAGFEGPLAGFFAGLQAAQTELLVTVPCDSPLFPHDLVKRLLAALHAHNADLAMAWAPEPDGQGGVVLRAQPVFCLMRRGVAASLLAFMQSGRRKIDTWTATLHTVAVPFDTATDDPQAFANVNTLDELAYLERQRANPAVGKPA